MKCFKQLCATSITLFTSVCFAQEDIADQQELLLIQSLMAHEETCIKGYIENKIYLREDKIYPTEKGLFIVLNDQGEYAPIPQLSSDSSGCFLDIENFSRITQLKIFNDCPDCEREYFLNCDNSECDSNKRKEEREREKQREKEEKRQAKEKAKEQRKLDKEKKKNKK